MTLDQFDFKEMLDVLDRTTNLLKVTLLSGWPKSFDLPTKLEAEQIISNFNELSLCDIGEDDEYRWNLAGNLVARYRRDIA